MESPNPQIPDDKKASRGRQPSPKQETTKPYDREERTFLFAKAVRAFIKRLPRTLANIEDARQLIDASGSVGANYIEANDALGKKDFLMHARISRKETKESRYWLRRLDVGDGPAMESERLCLIREAEELKLIFSAIIEKTK